MCAFFAHKHTEERAKIDLLSAEYGSYIAILFLRVNRPIIGFIRLLFPHNILRIILKLLALLQVFSCRGQSEATLLPWNDYTSEGNLLFWLLDSNPE